MENDSTAKSLKLYIVLSRAYKAINEHVNKVIQANGLNPTEFAVLELLYHKGDQPLQQIGAKILLASGSITYVVDKLEQKELLKRVACPKDRRVIFAQISDKGRQLIQDIFPEHARLIDQLMSSLTDAEKTEAIQLLKKLGIPAGKF